MTKKFFWRMADMMIATIILWFIIAIGLVINNIDNLGVIVLAIDIIIIVAGITAYVALNHNRKS